MLGNLLNALNVNQMAPTTAIMTIRDASVFFWRGGRAV